MKYRNSVFLMVLIFTLAINCQLFWAESTKQELNQWLMLGPAQVPDIEKDLLGEDKTLLDFNHIPVSDLLPVQGEKVPWSANRMLQWTVLKNPDFAGYETGVVYLATYLEPSRWLKTTLNIHNTNLGVSVFLDGNLIKAQLLKDKITTDLELTNEKHLLVLKVLLLKGLKFNFKASLEKEDPFQNETIAISLTPHHMIKPENILNVTDITGVLISPDGKRVAVSLNRVDKKTGKKQSWLEILDTSSGNRVFSSQNFGKISGFKWMGSSTVFSYTIAQKSKTSIFQYNLNSSNQEIILKDIKNFSDYWWAANHSFLVYCTYEKEDNGDHYKYIKEIPDRAKTSGYRYSMFIHFPFGGATHRISGEEQNFNSAIVSPNSQYILFTKTEPDYKSRPYSKKSYHLFDIKKLSIKPLLESNWIDDATWSPDSGKLLMVGGSSAFDGLGRNLGKEKIPNDYDKQVYIYELNTRRATAISKQFKPSIQDASWSSSYNNIYFVATDKADIGVFKYSLKRKQYRRLNTKVDVVRRIGFATKRQIAVYWGSSAVVPHKLYRLNLSSGNASLLKDYNKEYFKYTKIGSVKEWNFKTPKGKTITGRIHYPPNFNPGKKYPCIVYYYGGTSPVTRDFGGRYPKNWYAANGYIVYVLQPSGATGFGQEFSSVHVNDWGKVTSEEIIAGVKQLSKEHQYIDPQRIGAMGASYGGFMTQYLAASTDIFAAYISHAGISSLASYWGIGDWGYTYSGVATADSFPWNRKDIYVGHSPLFMAERITKPLLLLHGDIDNNVPPGESYQMFAALKLQGKEVELITFKDQSHWIQDYKQRLRWMRTIIAWWDKHLKNQPEHWQYLYH
ncbi:MAG: S9 family peptidase [Candidatus Aminicenantes bacterium]